MYQDNHYRYELNILRNGIGSDIMDSIINSYPCEYDYEFVGFINIYAPLEHIIPYDVTVVDLGCAAALQAYYFRNHAGYIGVDISQSPRYEIPSCEHYVASIEKYIDSLTINDQNKVFAICSYVPCEHELYDMIRSKFNNYRIYYPDTINVLQMNFS